MKKLEIVVNDDCDHLNDEDFSENFPDPTEDDFLMDEFFPDDDHIGDLFYP